MPRRWIFTINYHTPFTANPCSYVYPPFIPPLQKGDKIVENPLLQGGQGVEEAPCVRGQDSAIAPPLPKGNYILPPFLKGGRADDYYESARVGYIFNCTTYRGALFKGSWQVGAIATTCLRVSTALFMSIPLSLAALAKPPFAHWRLRAPTSFF